MSFTSSGLTFRSSIHLELFFEYGVSDFILLHVAARFSLHHLLESPSSPHCIFLPPVLKLRYHRCMGLFLGFISCSIGIHFCFHAISILSLTEALYYNMKSGRLIPQAVFFLKTALAIWESFVFPYELWNAFARIMCKMPLVILKGAYWMCKPRFIIYSSSKYWFVLHRRWNISLSVDVSFDFFY